MILEELLISKLQEASSITDVVGSKIYYSTADQNAVAPYIVVSSIDVFDREIHHSGAAAIARSRIQFDCLGRSALEAKQVANLVRVLFHGQRHTGTGITIFLGRAASQVQFEELNHGYREALDVIFTHSE